MNMNASSSKEFPLLELAMFRNFVIRKINETGVAYTTKLVDEDSYSVYIYASDLEKVIRALAPFTLSRSSNVLLFKSDDIYFKCKLFNLDKYNECKYENIYSEKSWSNNIYSEIIECTSSKLKKWANIITRHMS